MSQIASLPAGHTINEYRFERLLGVGGFGLTYLATDQNLHLPVAIKEYLPSEIAHRDEDSSIHPSSDEHRATFDWGLTRFLDEARTLAAFHHPNIVRVMRFFQANATAYMVMEFVQGASLSEWVKTRRPVGQKAIEAIIVPLVEGLATIHRVGYVHRDVKPGNIYIRADGSPVLLDFGAARAAKGGAELTAVVSPGYAPVEQYSEASPQGPWSDLYAIGGVMYWLVTGNKPVDATARLRDDPQRPAREAGDPALYAPEFLAAIDWALMPDDRLRPRSAEEFLARLRGVPHAASAAPSYDEPTRTLPIASVAVAVDDVRTVPTAPSTPAVFMQTMTGFTGLTLDREHLKKVEAALAAYVGPLAGVLVRKAAKVHMSIDALVEAVSGEIDDADDRAAFRRSLKGLGGQTQPPSNAPRTDGDVPTQKAAQRFDMAVLEKAERRLAQHIGAIAHVVVKRAAMKARDVSELYLIIGDEIADPADRKAFVKKAISAADRG